MEQAYVMVVVLFYLITHKWQCIVYVSNRCTVLQQGD